MHKSSLVEFNITQRPYRDETDQPMMIDLARQYPADHLRVLDLPYRLSSWALDEPENAHLWFNADGSLMGWGVLQTPFWTIDITYHPGKVTNLYREILAWANERACKVLDTPYGHPSWYVSIFSNQAEIIPELEAAGFSCQAEVGEDSWSKVFMHRTGALPVKDYRIPPGFTVRPLRGEAEVDAYVALHQETFETKNMTISWRRRTLQAPGYNPDLDLVVASPDGRLVAFCFCWLHGKRGQVEPLGCHADFRRYALGRIALAEGLRRLQAAGAENIYVETDNSLDTAMKLYEHMGFEVVRNVWIYRKDFT